MVRLHLRSYAFAPAAIGIQPSRSGGLIDRAGAEPVPDSWEWLDALAGELDDDFESAVREQPEPSERPELRTVFR